jgi:RNA polymerase sigma factor for flagellar operon FliA
MQTGSSNATIELRVKESYSLVAIVARQLRRQLSLDVPLEDLQSYGHEGLLQAARRFDESRGVPFRRWANLRIRGAILDGVRSYGNVPRRVYAQIRALQASDALQDAKIEDDAARSPAGPSSPEEADQVLTGYVRAMATAMAVQFLASPKGDELDRVVDEDDDASPEMLAERKELVTQLRDMLGTLPDNERTLLTRYYFDDVTLEEAGRELGLSKSWASRLHARAIETLEKRLRRRE